MVFPKAKESQLEHPLPIENDFTMTKSDSYHTSGISQVLFITTTSLILPQTQINRENELRGAEDLWQCQLESSSQEWNPHVSPPISDKHRAELILNSSSCALQPAAPWAILGVVLRRQSTCIENLDFGCNCTWLHLSICT